MKSDTPVVVEVRAIDVGYFSTKISLVRKIIGNSAVIGTALFPSLAPRLVAMTRAYSIGKASKEKPVWDDFPVDNDPTSH